MKPLETVGRVTTRDGQDLVLYHRDGAFQIRVGGMELTSSRLHGSEIALSELAQQEIPGVAAPRVLIGGLGMGYTLRAALDCFPRGARFLVAEVFPEVVAWNRGPLAHLAANPLADRRVEVLAADVAVVLDRGPFDAILLDVDNGPTRSPSSRTPVSTVPGPRAPVPGAGPEGILALWSAADEPFFERRMRRARPAVSPPAGEGAEQPHRPAPPHHLPGALQRPRGPGGRRAVAEGAAAGGGRRK